MKKLKINKIIASGLGTGYFPVAPGTAGSVLGIILIWLVNYCLIFSISDSSLVLVLDSVAIFLITFFGYFSIKSVHKVWKHDASEIVIDEIAGVMIAAFAVPFNWKYYLAALLLFRFFDILKPLYIKRIDRMKNNWSVMLDDILAGVYSFIVLQALIYFKVF